MIEHYKRKSNIAAGVFLVGMAITVARVGVGGAGQLSSPFLLGTMMATQFIAAIAFFCALFFYLKAKGQSGWWVCVMIFNVAGLIVIFVLKDKTKAQPQAAERGGGSLTN